MENEGPVVKGPAGQDVTHFGAICVRPCAANTGLEVLLITSRDSGRWVIPKGRPMGNRRPDQVARREAWEEAGVRGRAGRHPLGHFHYDKTLRFGGFAPCLVQVHLLEVSHQEDRFPEADVRRQRWFDIKDAAAAVNEPGLRALLLNLPVGVV